MEGTRPLFLVAVVMIVLVIVLALVLQASARAEPVGPPQEPGTVGGAGPKAGPVSIRWDGPSKCYPRELIAECVQYVHKMPGFGPVTGKERAALAIKAAQLGQKYRVAVRPDQLVAIRRMEVGLAARRSGVLALRHGEAIAAASRAGRPVLSIAAQYRLPPVTVLRQILLEEGYSSQEVRDAIAAPDTLPPQLAAEAPAIFEADIGSRLNAERIRAEAQEYEDAVGDHLRALGLDFETENDLRARAPPPPELPPLTPDFLFRSPVIIDGRPVYWLDAKAYPLYGSKLVAASLAKQAKKYLARFGPGAMVFGGGLMCGAQVSSDPGEKSRLLLLDGSHIGHRGSGAAAR